ncbi:unnamed protein product [Aphanomyces euteiches]
MRLKSTSSSTPSALSIIENKLQTSVKSADWKQALGTFQHFATTHPTWVQTKHANLVLKVCAAQGRPREAKKVLHIVKSLGIQGIEEPTEGESRPLDVTALEARALVCRALAENGKGAEALSKTHALVSSLDENSNLREKLPSIVYKPLLTAFKNKKDWQHTLLAMKQMQEFHVPISLQSYRTLFLALSSGRQQKKLVDVALQVLESPRFQLDVPTYTVMIKTLSATGDIEAALKVIAKMQASEAADFMSTKADINLYNAMIRTNMLASNMKESRRLLNEMQTLTHIKPNDFGFTTCMLGYLAQNTPKQVTSLFEEMKRREIAPSILTLACVLRALQELPQKKFLLPQLIDLAKQVPLEKPDFVHTLIDALDDIRQIETAQSVFQRALDQDMLGDWRRGLYSINLHSFSKGSAKHAVEYTLRTILNQPKSHRKTLGKQYHEKRCSHYHLEVQDLKIITGKGRRSKEYLTPVVKPQIEQLLKTHFGLRSYSPAQNPGILIVEKEHLEGWINNEEGEVVPAKNDAP